MFTQSGNGHFLCSKSQDFKFPKPWMLSAFYRHTESPAILQSDNGKEFINKEMHSLCERFNIVYKHSRLCHPQSNGLFARFNQTLTGYLQKYIFEEEKEKLQKEQKT
ncbi:Gag-Pol polyprotein [Nosema granulosis]|uniref:Gag-Pol polyprotein n=1 Tax=Nosema granulosis TaxID=83296 RepID=A0A9P6H056_9MICR|nr:Gag-Pol polyprotein [Nosema granulosis]